MKTSTKNWRTIGFHWGITLVLSTATATFAQSQTTRRPISDFVDQQGTYCLNLDATGIPICPTSGADCHLFVPPLPNFLGWFAAAPPELRNASVDYAGLAAAYLASQGIELGTTTSGTVTERRLDNGRAEVKVVLHTKNALTWVIQGGDFANDPLLFGHRAADVQAGADPSLGMSTFQVIFNNTAPGVPLPDLEQLFNCPESGQDLIYLNFQAQAEGPLHAAFGVPDGTPGRAKVTQTGVLFRGQFNGATADGFPAERINLKIVGQ